MTPEPFSWMTAFIVFVLYIIFDILYALYVLCVSRQQALAASGISAVLYSLGAYGVITYLHNIWYLIPLALGAFLGTYIAVKYMGNWHG
jgi:uncharacterized protein YebE (UPF0316 family)